MNRITRILIVTAALSSAAFGAKSSPLAPVLAKPGAPTVDESFSTSALGKLWTVAKGTWEVHDGTLVGREKKEDNHPAVLTLGQKNHDSIIRFSFKFDGTDNLSLSFNHTGGHLFRVNIAKDGVTILKDGDKKNPAIKSEQLGKAAAKFEQGQWYTMLVEVAGTKVSVQTDNGVKLSASNDALNVDKTGYRFVVKGASVALADVKAWEVAGGAGPAKE
ncbi:MAG: family 16 glycoside hydrolase [Chthoniobacteraceae bacterium]